MISSQYIDPFFEVIGHFSQVKQLRHIISINCVPHAIMLSGPNGIGKRLVARALACAMVCNNPVSKKDYETVKNGNHPDVHLVFKEKDKRDLPVENIRELCRELHLSPYNNIGSVGIIDNAHSMSLSAHNALLMTLEEPCEKSKLILVTHSPNKIPETIISRCQIIHFAALTALESVEVLNNILTKISAPSNYLEQLSSICKEGLGLLNLDDFIDPVSLTVQNESQEKKDLLEHLGNLSSEIKNINSLLDSVCSSKKTGAPEANALCVAAKLAEQKTLPEHVWHTMHTYFRTKITQSTGQKANALSDILTQSLEAHEIVKNRSANLSLQLSSLFLKASESLQSLC